MFLFWSRRERNPLLRATEARWSQSLSSGSPLHHPGVLRAGATASTSHGPSDCHCSLVTVHLSVWSSRLISGLNECLFISMHTFSVCVEGERWSWSSPSHLSYSTYHLCQVLVVGLLFLPLAHMISIPGKVVVCARYFSWSSSIIPGTQALSPCQWIENKRFFSECRSVTVNPQLI